MPNTIDSSHIRLRMVARPRPYVPIPFTPPPPAYPVMPKAAVVRPYVLHSERQRQRLRDERSRQGLAVLLRLAQPHSLAVAA
ncbi:MAG UNVERIFIED_CONTAM: hypothetical protein LOD86_04130 [Thermobifida fusca]|nr:hypothetical protein [Thermobifida fusca]